MNIRQINEEISKILKEDSDFDYEAWENLRDIISEKVDGTIDVTLEDEYETPWIAVWFDIDNDLHDSYDHEPLLKEIRDVVKGADDITEMGDGIIALFLGINTETSEETLKRIIDEVNQVRPIIDKYWQKN